MRRRLLGAAIGLEAGVLVLAGLAAWLLRVPLGDSLRLTPATAAWVVAFTVPLAGAMWLMATVEWRPFARLRRAVEALTNLPFVDARVVDLVLISLLAGVGEEALFRGVLQEALSRWSTPLLGLVVASLLFGLAHLITPTYAAVATLLGAYLGVLYLRFDNLVIPMGVHGLYDLAALIYLRRGQRDGMATWPISLDDVRAARERLRTFVPFPTPLRAYEELDAAVGRGVHLLVKHENHQPTNSFKVRNGLSAMTALPEAARRRGVIAATRGNHGQGVALAGRWLGVPVTICVPVGNNREKNAAMRGFGAELIEEGEDFDAALVVMDRLIAERGLTPVHSTNDPAVLAGAGTIALEIIEQTAVLDAMVIAVGGGSQAVGTMTVLRALRPEAKVYGVQAEGAATIHDSWHAGERLQGASADTFADGIATRSTYELTYGALQTGLEDFVTVSDGEIAGAMRLLLRTTHNLIEPAAAAGLAGVMKLGDRLAGQTVGIILTGANVDQETLRRVVRGDI